MMRKGLLTLAVATGALMFASQANADFVNFYESIASGKVQKIDSGALLYGTISATTGQDASTSRPMTIANSGSEIGIGVCGTSDGGVLCMKQEDIYDYSGNWNGQGDELENLGDQEWVRLTQTSNAFTGDFKLGSLDNSEAGNITWDYNNTTQEVTFQHVNSTTASILYDTTGGMANISHISGNVFVLSITGFITDSMVTFRSGCGTVAAANGCSVGTDNDYLVAGASVVPIPAALPLFATALAGFGVFGWRKKRAQAA